MKTIKSLDLYRKTPNIYIEQTSTGGLLTIIALAIMFSLFISEVQSFFDHTIKKSTIIDQSLDSSSVQININITLHSIPCIAISLDHQDDVSQHIMDFTKTLSKLRILKNGVVFSENPEKTLENLIEAIKYEEGCRLEGFIDVARVPGNLHISLHAAHDMIHLLPREYLIKLNFSHTLNELSIGNADLSNLIEKDFNAQEIIKYQNITAYDKQGVTKHEYFFRIIPMQFINECNGEKTSTFTCSLNSNSDFAHAPFGVIYFRYSFEDLTMRYTKLDKTLGSFFVSLCAILGGIFVVLGLINKLAV